jgi:hypothetical protein
MTGKVSVSGKVEAELPPKLVEEYITSSGNSDTRERKRLLWLMGGRHTHFPITAVNSRPAQNNRTVVLIEK